MKLHEIEGRDMRHALERAREELGDRAVVITHRATPEGVSLAVSPDVPTSPVALDGLRLQAQQMLLGSEAERRRAPRVATADVERCMGLTGASEAFTAEIVRRVRERGAEDQHPLDVAAAEIGGSFAVAKAGLPAGTTGVMAFVGPTGVGKTTTIAKLAARMIRGGRRVAVATLDAYRVGAVQQWRAYGKLLGVPVHVLRDASQLPPRAGSLRGLDALLVDTSGHIARDVEQLTSLREGLAHAERPMRLDGYLVLSAVNTVASLAGLTRSVTPLAPSGCVITKLDETSLPAPVLEHARTAGLPVAFLSNGPDIAHDFRRASPEAFADLFLNGRLR